MVWKLLKLVYGLRTSPKDWQYFFARVLTSPGGQGRNSDADVYFFEAFETYLMGYVDDVVIAGNYQDELFSQIQEHVLLIPPCELQP